MKAKKVCKVRKLIVFMSIRHKENLHYSVRLKVRATLQHAPGKGWQSEPSNIPNGADVNKTQ